MDVLQTQSIEEWTPDDKMYRLPFPSLFNITIVQSNHLAGCDGTPVVCHKFVSDDGCLVTVCHAIKDTKVFEVVVTAKQVQKPIKAIVMCRYGTTGFDKNGIAFNVLNKQPGDPICHFTMPETFVVCKKV
ncbi:unnamed protein product [Didymodactylos carnosus]|uniref:BURP domain-containing protein n=1 Tax=Didymodactylos carnosus TaxID=1234261 RepID=A0A8S2EIY7_9BILA|nr:unnamed protein product [Didymodactylos carnosus]CAF4046066.1 unnamed protein product [Didymodactylos carnosus]